MKKAFTLIELLVVIAILGILSGVLLGSFSGGSDSARSARCMTNMRNLAAACQTYAMAHKYYPLAGSIERFQMDTSLGKRNIRQVYHDLPGWISWKSKGAYVNKPTSAKAQASWSPSMYEQDDEARIYALTNGALWKYVSANHEVYRCPSHMKAKKKLNPNWSYVMNAYFGWTANPGSEAYEINHGGVGYGNVSRADRILLFAEIPFADIGVISKETQTGYDCDAILQYPGLAKCSQNETIGFNHRSGKLTCANVAFADGHVEKIVYPKQELSQAEQEELTTWLCTGVDISFNGRKYEKMTP